MLNFEPCCPAQSVLLYRLYFILSVFYEQINDDDDMSRRDYTV